MNIKDLEQGQKLIFDFLDDLRKLESTEMIEVTREMTVTLILIIRGIEGDEFVKDFLTAAIANKEKMVLSADKPSVKH